jgi:hypothetical protein
MVQFHNYVLEFNESWYWRYMRLLEGASFWPNFITGSLCEAEHGLHLRQFSKKNLILKK